MRVRFKATREQRAALRAQLARLQDPATLQEVLGPILPAGIEPSDVSCTVPSVHPDRFVLRVQLHSNGGGPRGYALKVYSDDFAQRVWEHSQLLAQHHRANDDGLCLATGYVPDERMLVFPWVDGVFLSEVYDSAIPDDRKRDLLRRAATLAADLHRLPLVPEPPTTAQMLVDDTLARCGRLQKRWPQTTQLIEPLMDVLQEAASVLDPAVPALVHGDLSAGQFLWTGERLVLLDLDMFGYTDPAYDAGHYLGQLERRCELDESLPPHKWGWLPCFCDAYLAAMPQVSPRNVAFYRGLTLVRKIYTICRRDPLGGPALAPRLAIRAGAILRELTSPEYAR